MISCPCVFDANVDDLELEVLQEKFTTSKLNNRTCCECNKDIVIGEKHRYECVKNEDYEVSVYRTCLDCFSIRNNLCCDWIYTRVLDDVEEAIMEAAGNVSEDCIVRLTPKAKEFVFSVIESAWEELMKEEDKTKQNKEEIYSLLADFKFKEESK